MRSVHTAIDNVVLFRRPGRPQPQAPVVSPSLAARRVDQRALMDAVYASGTLAVAAGDRETKLIAARLQVYGFLTVEELGEDSALRRLRPSEAIRAQVDRPWRLSKAAYGSGLSVTVPAADDFLFDSSAGASA